jgi:hypothetical protein
MIRSQTRAARFPRRNNEGTLYGIGHELLPWAKVRIDVLPDNADPRG